MRIELSRRRWRRSSPSEPGPNGEPAELDAGQPRDRVRRRTIARRRRHLADAGGRRAARASTSPTTRWPASWRRRSPPPPASAVKARVVEQHDRGQRAEHRGAVPGPVPDVRERGGRLVRRLPAAELPRAEARRARGGRGTATTSCSTPTSTRCRRPASRTCSVTDLSTRRLASPTRSFDVNEWRHRHAPDRVAHRRRRGLQGHARRRRLLHGRRRGARAPTPATGSRFDVVPENGDTWQLDLSHLLRGAHTLIDEKVLLEDAGGETRFQSDVDGPGPGRGRGVAELRLRGQRHGSVVHGLYGGEGTTNRAFTGDEQPRAHRAPRRQTITVEFGFDLFAKSNSNAFFPAAGGDEVAIRFGANDTITNGFTAGGYPGARQPQHARRRPQGQHRAASASPGRLEAGATRSGPRPGARWHPAEADRAESRRPAG